MVWRGGGEVECGGEGGVCNGGVRSSRVEGNVECRVVECGGEGGVCNGGVWSGRVEGNVECRVVECGGEGGVWSGGVERWSDGLEGKVECGGGGVQSGGVWRGRWSGSRRKKVERRQKLMRVCKEVRVRVVT